jgi:hypothetical protein
MNETDFIRQQLAAERAHLREILDAVRRGTAAAGSARPVAAYLEWAGRRLAQQLGAHQAALQATGDAAIAEGLSRLATARDGANAKAGAFPVAQRAEQWLALLDAWTEALDAQAGRSLRLPHWRAAAGLNADSILEERRLHAAARHAAGLA